MRPEILYLTDIIDIQYDLPLAEISGQSAHG
jgi:hypothetical protein